MNKPKEAASALYLLTEAAKAEKAKRHPLVNPNYLPVTKYSDKTSSGLTKCIIDCFRLMLKAYATRINTMGTYSEKQGKWIKSGSTPGTADIHACYNGIHYSIEVKIGRDVQSEHQLATQQLVEAAGGRYFVARDFQSFYDWISQGREAMI